ncbi:MAG: hypothetical protein IKO41_05435 [Lachnospiraceae bacterium]|nr:hypothetical protein [Lachnospiraceae bacterium]
MDTKQVGEITERAKHYIENREYYLLKYIYDKDYELLSRLLCQEIYQSYANCVKEILGTRTLSGKNPLNPFVAAGIGDAIAGPVGAISMGVAAAEKTRQHEENVEQFLKDVAHTEVAAEKLSIIVKKLDEITMRPPQPIYPDNYREELYQKVEEYIKKPICKNPMTELVMSIAKQISGYKDIDTIYSKLENAITNQTARHDYIQAKNALDYGSYFCVGEKELEAIEYLKQLPSSFPEYESITSMLKQVKRRVVVFILTYLLAISLAFAVPILAPKYDAPLVYLSLFTTTLGTVFLFKGNRYMDESVKKEYTLLMGIGFACMIVSILIFISQIIYFYS